MISKSKIIFKDIKNKVNVQNSDEVIGKPKEKLKSKSSAEEKIKIIKSAKLDFDKRLTIEREEWKDYVDIDKLIERYELDRNLFLEKMKEFGISSKSKLKGIYLGDYILKTEAKKVIEEIKENNEETLNKDSDDAINENKSKKDIKSIGEQLEDFIKSL